MQSWMPTVLMVVVLCGSLVCLRLFHFFRCWIWPRPYKDSSTKEKSSFTSKCKSPEKEEWNTAPESSDNIPLNAGNTNPLKPVKDKLNQDSQTGHTAVTRLLECKDKDPYSTLGLNTTNASDADIKKAYKRHAFLVHPDKNQHPGAEEAFKILGSAYDQIGDEIKRQEYERQERQKKEDEAMKREVEEWLRQFEENDRRFKEQMELARTTMLCGSCKGRHKRILIERPLYSARYCQSCHERHPAKENDLWAETSDLFTWMPTYKYFACMEGKIYDVTEWAVCNKYEAISYHANSHQVLFHICTQPRPMDPPENERYHPNRSRESRDNGNFISKFISNVLQTVKALILRLFFPPMPNGERFRDFGHSNSFRGQSEEWEQFHGIPDWYRRSSWQQTNWHDHYSSFNSSSSYGRTRKRRSRRSRRRRRH